MFPEPAASWDPFFPIIFHIDIEFYRYGQLMKQIICPNY